jgi:hypothetical protein
MALRVAVRANRNLARFVARGVFSQMTSSLLFLSENPFLWVVAAVVLGSAFWGVFSERKRKAAMREYARTHHMEYLGKAVPTSFHVEGLSVWRPSDKVNNLMLGMSGDKEFALFDFHARRRKRSSRQTAVAFRTSKVVCPPKGIVNSTRELCVENTGEWLVYFAHKRLVSTSDLEGFVSEARLNLSDRGID